MKQLILMIVFVFGISTLYQVLPGFAIALGGLAFVYAINDTFG